MEGSAKGAGEGFERPAPRFQRLRVTLCCAVCGLDLVTPVHCATCLAPHHEDCFARRGSCGGPECLGSQVVAPLSALAPKASASSSGRAVAWALVLGASIGFLGLLTVGSRTASLVDEVGAAAPPELAEAHRQTLAATARVATHDASGRRALGSAFLVEPDLVILAGDPGRGLQISPTLELSFSGQSERAAARVVATHEGVTMARIRDGELAGRLPQPLAFSSQASAVTVGETLWQPRFAEGSAEASLVSLRVTEVSPQGFVLEGPPSLAQVGAPLVDAQGMIRGVEVKPSSAGQRSALSGVTLGGFLAGEVTEIVLRDEGASAGSLAFEAKCVNPGRNLRSVRVRLVNAAGEVIEHDLVRWRGRWQGTIAAPGWDLDGGTRVEAVARRRDSTLSVGKKLKLSELRRPVSAKTISRRAFGKKLRAVTSSAGPQGRLFVLRASGDALIELDPASLRGRRSLPLSGGLVSVWCSGETAFLAREEPPSLVLIDLAEWRVKGSWPLPDGATPLRVVGRAHGQRPGGRIAVVAKKARTRSLLTVERDGTDWSEVLGGDFAWGLPVSADLTVTQGAWSGPPPRGITKWRRIGAPRPVTVSWLPMSNPAAPIFLTRDGRSVVVSRGARTFIGPPSTIGEVVEGPGWAIAELVSGEILTWRPQVRERAEPGVEVLRIDPRTHATSRVIAYHEWELPQVANEVRQLTSPGQRFQSLLGPRSACYVEGAERLVYYQPDIGWLVSLPCAPTGGK